MRTTRALAAEEALAEKRRKVGNGELRSPSSPFVQITTAEETQGPCAVTVNLGHDQAPVFCCSSKGLTELQFIDDLEGSVEFETIARYNLDTTASKLSSEFKAGSGAPETITSKPSMATTNSRRTVPTAELEEFFASAENEIYKRFKDKYNFDVVNETPLEGRFEWVQLKP